MNKVKGGFRIFNELNICIIQYHIYTMQGYIHFVQKLRTKQRKQLRPIHRITAIQTIGTFS